MSERVCRNVNCNKPLYSFHHLNRRYCSDYCYYENKLMVTNTQNEQKRIALHISVNDDILKELYIFFGDKEYISAAVLESKKFDWSLCSEEIVRESFNVRVIKNYGYTLFNNETVLVWKV